jgi:alkylhydroperoxidase family enzyme
MSRVPAGEITSYDPPGENPNPPRLLLAVGHPAAVADAMLDFFRTLVNGAVDARTRKLATLAVAAELKNGYEWGHHAESALRLGITADEVAAIKSGVRGVLSDQDQSLVDYVVAVERRSVTDDLWRALAARHAVDELVQLTVIGGYYGMLARIQDALAVDQDQGFAGAF